MQIQKQRSPANNTSKANNSIEVIVVAEFMYTIISYESIYASSVSHSYPPADHLFEMALAQIGLLEGFSMK
jgi:hypothetical protein